MHVGRSYRVVEFAMWSRRSVVYMVLLSLLAIALFLLPPIQGFALPWQVVVMLGTTVSLVAGFKNSQVLGRSAEGLQAFAQIAATSRMLAGFCRDFCEPQVAKILIHRHIAWLTALRFGLRRPMPWESMSRRANIEYRRRYHILEDTTTLNAELARLAPEAAKVSEGTRPEIDLLSRQAEAFITLFKAGSLPPQIYVELTKLLRDCHDQQARCDRIKNNPYPRQYAIVSAMLVWCFCTFLPFGVVALFSEMGIGIWLAVPFSTLIGWMYMSLDQVGESTSNPFEGNANDVPISQICRDLEIELRSLLGESEIPKPLPAINGIAT